jgi:hypothetical protein
MESDYVSAERVISVIKSHGSDATYKDGLLTVFPAEGAPGSPAVYVIGAEGVRRRVIAQIASKCGIGTHLFWQPVTLVKPAS